MSEDRLMMLVLLWFVVVVMRCGVEVLVMYCRFLRLRVRILV